MATEKQVLSLTREVAATFASSQYYCVKLNTSEQWAVATTAGQRIDGIMQENPASGNGKALLNGISKAVAGAAVSRGALLTTDSSGRVVTANDNDDYVLGFAVTAATAAGNVITVVLTHSGAVSSLTGQETYTSSADYSTNGQYRAMKPHSVAGQIVQCSAAGERGFGILQNAPDSGEEAEVCTVGECTGRAGTGGLTPGQAFTTDANGELIAATGTQQVLGWSLATIADEATGSVFVMPAGGLLTSVAVANMYSAARGRVFRTDAANAVSELNVSPIGSIPLGDGTDVVAFARGAAGDKLAVKADDTALIWENGKEMNVTLAGMGANDDPQLQEFDHTVAPGTTGAHCYAVLADGTKLGYWVLGAGQTILGPVGATDGIDIACDQTNNEGLEVYSHGFAADGRPFAVGIDAAFYMLIKINIQLINGCDDLFVGFKKMETYNADMEAYDTYFGLGLNTAAAPGAIKVREELNGGGAANTDTTDTIASATDLQIKVLVSAAGVATVQHDAAVPGTLAAPTVTSAFTFDDGDLVQPICRFLHANAAQAGAIITKTWRAGLQ